MHCRDCVGTDLVRPRSGADDTCVESDFTAEGTDCEDGGRNGSGECSPGAPDVLLLSTMCR
jgi:hypothetical protein